MNKELLNAISKLMDEKLEPIKKDIEELKLQPNNDYLQEKIIKDIDYMSGYYYNRTQKMQ